ncbi:unnamed protein product [Brassica oleracea var. botrytis]
MYMAFIEVCLWTLLAFVLTWTTYHVTNRRKKTTKLADAAVEEIRDGGPDVIVVGAGVGGSALAYALAKDGRRVHVIERNMREPERMMGEFMQPEGRLMLSKLDLQDYQSDQYVETLLKCIDVTKTNIYWQRVARRRNGEIFGRRKRSNQRSDIQEQFRPRNDGIFTLTVVCDRCYSNLRRSLNDNNVPPKLRKIYLKGIEEGANIKVTPTKRMPATLSRKKGVIGLGDAFNMHHPGIASGMMPLGNLGDTNKVSEVIKAFYVIRKPMSTTANILGNAFSQVLVALTDQAREAMRQGCYDYLSSGGLRLYGVSLKLLIPHLKAEGVIHMMSPINAAAYCKNYMTATAV